MALIRKVGLASTQSKVDQAVTWFVDSVELSDDLKQFSDENLTEANRAAGLLLDFEGNPMTAAQLAEIKARIDILAAFASWAKTNNPAIGNATPDKKLRGIRQVVQ